MALGDYSNSRGAADMGVLPDRLPGYAQLSDSSERERFRQDLGRRESPTSPASPRRANDGSGGERQTEGALRRRREPGEDVQRGRRPISSAASNLLVVHDMFLTETAQRADVVLPAASSYEKDGTLTNTAGEVQMTHRSIDPQGPRSDFDLIRILSHQLSMLGVGAPIKLRTAEAAFDEIRQNVPGYDISVAGLLPAAALQNQRRARNGGSVVRCASSEIFFLQTIISLRAALLGRYCSKLTSTNEAKDRPWSSSSNTSTAAPGGIASKNRRFAVCGNDGVGVPHLV